MNPSTAELLAAIDAAAGERGAGAAEQPERDHGRRGGGEAGPAPGRASSRHARRRRGSPRCWPSTASRDAADNADAVDAARRSLAVGGVAEAAKDDPDGRFAVGDAIGYRGDELVAWGDPSATLAATLAALADGAELVTCIAGAGAPLDADAVAAAVPGGIELDFHDGGQPAWWWLLCAE